MHHCYSIETARPERKGTGTSRRHFSNWLRFCLFRASPLFLLATALWLQGLSASVLAEGPGDLDWPATNKEHRPGVYWWWPGSAVDRENITWNLETLQKAGIGGAHIIPIYGVKGEEERFIPYLSPKWMEMLDHSVAEAERLGMWVDMSTGTGWPFGGSIVPPEDGEMRLAVKDGKAEIQRANWRVKRAAPGGVGDVLNPYDLKALDAYLSHFDRAFAASGTRMPRAQYHDSFEYRGNWCRDFFDQFRGRRGYDLNEHMDALAGVGDPETISRVKCDYRQTLAELHLEFIERWADWSHGHGCIARNQAHGSPTNLLDTYAAVDVPETEIFGASVFEIPGLRREPDNVNDDPIHPLIAYVASSAAHVAGRQRVSSETCTWLRNHFRSALSQAKPEIDQLFLSGINHVFYHGCCYSPRDAEWPGWLFYASTEANPRNAFWRDIPALNEYIARCQSILQSGKPSNDILLYWPVYDLWSKPDGLNQNCTVHSEGWLTDSSCGHVAMDLRKQGYQFDFISDRQLQQVKATRKGLESGGATYGVVLVPPVTHMPVATLAKLAQLAKEGAPVWFADSLPTTVPGFANKEGREAELNKVRTSMDSSVRILDDASESLDPKIVRRERMGDLGLKCIRRTHGEGYHYFIANMDGRRVDQWVPIARSAASAVILDPMTGDSGIATTRSNKGGTEVYLQLEPGQTCILRSFTEKEAKGDRWPVLSPGGDAVEVAGTWTVDFVDGAPELPGSFSTDELKSWTELGGDEARRFAGTGRYGIEFELPSIDADEWRLELGVVRESARVFVNGHDAGTLFALPYKLNIGEYLKPGTNMLEVEVTNLSANRIRDLDTRRVPWKKFYDINFVNHNYKPFDASKWELTPSGLFGPVRLVPLRIRQPGNRQ